MVQRNVARPRSRIGRLFRGTLLVAVILALAAHAVGGWIYATWIHDAALVPRVDENVVDGAVIAIDGDRVTVRPEPSGDDDLSEPGLIGFDTGEDYLRLGEVVAVTGEYVTRSFEVMAGSVPSVGALGSIDLNGSDPELLLTELGIRETTYPGPLGTMEAWVIDGSSTWIIHVHDRRSGVEQSLRMMGVLHPEGATQLAITYRNDPGQPADATGLAQYGVTERDDLAAAIAHARESGAANVFVVGYGSGASIALAEMYRDPDIAGLLLDSPVLDAKSTVMAAATSAEGLVGRMPSTIAEVGVVMASLRYGVSWDTIDYLGRSDQLRRPVLVLQGTADGRQSVDDARALADANPEVVTLVEIEGATADRTWNLDPQAYEGAVLGFLDQVRAGA